MNRHVLALIVAFAAAILALVVAPTQFQILAMVITFWTVAFAVDLLLMSVARQPCPPSCKSCQIRKGERA